MNEMKNEWYEWCDEWRMNDTWINDGWLMNDWWLINEWMNE
jgi:hypothetical protein